MCCAIQSMCRPSPGFVYILYDPIADQFWCEHMDQWVSRYRVYETMPAHRWTSHQITGWSARDMCAVATRYTQASSGNLPGNGIYLCIGELYDLG